MRDDSSDDFDIHKQVEGCPICDFPLPKYGSAVPPPHYSLQHRLVIYAVRRRLSQRVICCDVCPDEVQVGNWKLNIYLLLKMARVHTE